MKRLPVIVGLGVLLLLAGLMLAGRRGGSPSAAAAVYDGKPLDVWLYRYFRHPTEAEFETNYRALKALRASSVPALAELCLENTHPQRWERLLVEVRRHLGDPNANLTRQDIHQLSEFALRTFEPRGSELLPAAERRFAGGWVAANRRDALSLLRFTATEPEACVPLLARAYRDRAVEVGETASEVARDLWKEGVPPNELLEPLVGFLRRGAPDFGAMDDSYALLGSYGAAASNAVPFVRERYGREPTNAAKIHLAVAWTRIDPAGSVPLDFLVNTALDEPMNPLRSAAYQGLLRVGPSGGAAARRLMEQLRQEPSNAALVDVLAVMGKVPAPDSPGAATTLPSLFPPAIRTELIGHLHRTMQDAARTNALDDRLNSAWRVLQLAPGDASAWAVFRSQLLQEVENDPTNGNVLWVSTAMQYLLSIPVVRERKKELLREVQRFYDNPGSGKHQFLRRQAMRYLIDLDPAERPEAVAELIQLYL